VPAVDHNPINKPIARARRQSAPTFASALASFQGTRLVPRATQQESGLGIARCDQSVVVENRAEQPCIDTSPREAANPFGREPPCKPRVSVGRRRHTRIVRLDKVNYESARSSGAEETGSPATSRRGRCNSFDRDNLCKIRLSKMVSMMPAKNRACVLGQLFVSPQPLTELRVGLGCTCAGKPRMARPIEGPQCSIGRMGLAGSFTAAGCRPKNLPPTGRFAH